MFKVPNGDEFGSTALYASDGQAYVKKSVEESSHMQFLKDKQSASVFVPDSEDSFAHKSSEHDPAFEAFCVKVMTDQGCFKLPSFSAPSVTEVHAPIVEVAREAQCEDDIILCQHNVVVKNSSGTCIPCKKCVTGPAGRVKLFDGWGEIIGYKE